MLNRWVWPGLLLMVMANAASPEDKVWVNAGFLKTEKYVELRPGEQAIYAPADDKSAVFSIHRCLKDMNNIQVAAIITKYAKDHPESWHIGANLLAYQALRQPEVCPIPDSAK